MYTLPLKIAIKLKYALFNRLITKMSTFSVENCLVQILPTLLMSKCLAENDVKTDIIMSHRPPDIMHRNRLTPRHLIHDLLKKNGNETWQ